MRLLKASSIDSRDGLQLVSIDHYSRDSEPYVILSHTWGATDDEVTLNDVLNNTFKSKPGYKKIEETCRKALEDGFEYVWVDTCCIDKTSSAELSEAINSMFRWYMESTVCYALLSDCPSDVDVDDPNSTFAKSRWFTRGWTLQELLAPQDVVFFSQDWTAIGTKATLSSPLSHITRISSDILKGEQSLFATSIANRMGWASRRVTRRPEDIAYCLMGLFSVNMPLLYGEGDNAFYRLQEEIMKSSTDHTLFAWLDEDAGPGSSCGILARSPAMFSKTHMVHPFENPRHHYPYSVTNMGLSIFLDVEKAYDDIRIARFQCFTPEFKEDRFFGVYLKPFGSNGQRYARVRPREFASVHHANKGSLSMAPSQIYINLKPADGLDPVRLRPPQQLIFRRLPSPSLFDITDIVQSPPSQSGQILNHSIRILEHNTGQYAGSAKGPKYKSVYFRKGDRTLTAVFMIKGPQDRRIILAIGSLGAAMRSWTVGWCALDPLTVASLPDQPDYEPTKVPPIQAIQLFYRPRALGQSMCIGDLVIGVSGEAEDRNNVRQYVLDISITSTGEDLHKPSPQTNDLRSDGTWSTTASTLRVDEDGSSSTASVRPKRKGLGGGLGRLMRK